MEYDCQRGDLMKLELIELCDMVMRNVKRMRCSNCGSKVKFVSVNEYVYVWVTVTVKCVPCDAEVTFKAQVQDY